VITAMKILLVEDDALIAEPLTRALLAQHYVVDVATDGHAAWELMESFTYDLILLDVGLPKLDGISLCRQLRSQGNQTPILLLTAQNASTNKVLGLDAGADDYVAKPFNLQELLARIRALLRRGNTTLPPLLEWQNLQLDPSLCEVTCNRQLVRLTPKEYSLLELLLRNPHRIFSSSALIDHIWSFEEPPTEDTIRSHVKGLRQKLKASGAIEDPIETIYGIGYRLRPATQNRQAPTETAPLDQTPFPQESSFIDSTGSAAKLDANPEYRENDRMKSDLRTGMFSLWQQFKETVEHRVTILEHAVTLLLQNQLEDELRHEATQAAHKLAGSLGMFGADEGSRLAQEIEPLFEMNRSLNLKQKKRLSHLVNLLRQELQNIDRAKLSAQLSEQMLQEDLNSEQLELLLVSSNAEFVAQLQAEAPRWGLRPQSIENPVAARAQICEQRPGIVFLDMTSAHTWDNSLTLLAELGAYTPPVPVLVLVKEDNLLDRIKVNRLGGYRVLQQPMTATQVLEATHQVLQHTQPSQAMVMVVDDDQQVLTALQQLLIPWGLHVSVLNDPLQFLNTLDAIRPDLLILDVEMPQVNGIELCRVVRNDPQWSGLPVLFLTAHTDAETMQQVFAAGADDYVCKPVVGPELVTRILNRLERSRLLKSLAETDALTGIANRHKSTQAITQFLQWCRHCQQPFCFALIKLRNLKQINQQYGYAAGDAVLSRFGELLRQTFHREDVVGRWGGATFVVGMPRSTADEGSQRLHSLQKALHQFEFRATNGALFRVAFRASVVQSSPSQTDVYELYQAAEEVFSQDKRSQDKRKGGDRPKGEE
jgi:diguanylate cyclase (GGDEF)-like protein